MPKSIHRNTNRGKYSERGTGRLYKRGKDGKEYSAGDRHSGVYYLEYRINGKRTRQRLVDIDGNPITSREEAEKERARITAPFSTASKTEQLQAIKAKLETAEKEHATVLDSIAPPLKLSKTWDTYLESTERPDSGERTLKDYKGYWSRFEQWVAASLPRLQNLNEIDNGIAKDYASDLVASKVSPNTFNKHIGFLKLLFNVLEVHAHIEENPFARIRKKKLKTNVRRELTIAELRTVLNTASGELLTLLFLGTFTGLRLGDCATLKWSEVDLDRRVIRRIPNKTSSRGGTPVLVGISPALYEQLVSISVSKRKGLVLPNLASKYAKDPGAITKQIQKHFSEKCGIQIHKEGTGFRIIADPNNPRKFKKVHTGKRAVVEVGFHSLRHTFVSLQAEGGTPLAVVQAIVGHGSPAMTRHYTHIGEAATRQAALAMPSNIIDAEFEEILSPIPEWVKEKLMGMTDKNWRKIRDELCETPK